MTSWYDRVTDLLGEPGSDVADLDPALSPEDVDLLLRAASDLLPPAEAQALADRWGPDSGDAASPAGGDDGATLPWTSLVEQAQSWAPADDDGVDAPHDLALTVPHTDLDLEFGTGAGAYDDDGGDAPLWPGGDDDEDDGGGLGSFGAGLHQLDLPEGGELEHQLGEHDGFDDDAPVDDDDPDAGSSAWDDGPAAHHHDY